MQKQGPRILAMGMLLLLAACGSGGNIGTSPAVDVGNPGTPGSVYRVGTLTGADFVQGALGLGTSQISAGGQTSVAVDIVDAAGQRLNGISAVVTFTSVCVSNKQSRIEPLTVTTTQGRASATYFAAGCAGADTVRASVVVGASTLTAEATLMVGASEVGSISFVSATPTLIGMRGTPYEQQSVVVFRLRNRNGGAVANRPVQFAVSNRVGGLQLSPAQNTTDANGMVQTTLAAGTAQTTVRITATATTDSGQTLVTQSEELIVSTGLPDADSMSLSSAKLSLDGNCDGDSAAISLRAADRYNNPPAGGTAVAFTTEGGKINSGCTTADPGDPTSETGVCSTLLSVQSPRPANGRVTVLASLSGEESFTDANSNGYYEAGEPFVDLLEPYRDDNESSQRDNNEFFRDANDNGVYEASGNGSFDGYICAVAGNASNGNTPGNCGTRTFPLGASIVVVFSNAEPQISNVSGQSATYRTSSAGAVNVVVGDTNGNSLPTGTTFMLTISNGSVDAPDTRGPFNTTSPTALSFRFMTGATATPVGGQEAAKLVVNLPTTGCGAGVTRTYTLFNYTVI